MQNTFGLIDVLNEMGLAGTRRLFNICACVRLCVCVALNKWPMTHNKNYYE